jgi:hypothetical protein
MLERLVTRVYSPCVGNTRSTHLRRAVLAFARDDGARLTPGLADACFALASPP